LSKLYMVAHWEQGILEVGTYEDCKKTYDQECEGERNQVINENEFNGNERVVLAEVKTQLFAEPTGETNENNEAYWDWKEEIY